MNSPHFDPDYGEQSDVTALVAALHQAVAGLPHSAAPALLAQLSSLTMALSARLVAAGSGVPPTECLSLAELAKRLRLGQSTIRKMVDSRELQEGIHFRRVRRRLIFFWSAVEAFLKTSPALKTVQPAEAIPFVRRGRRRA